jgi:hypothetical protein
MLVDSAVAESTPFPKGGELVSIARRYGWPPLGVSSVSFVISARERERERKRQRGGSNKHKNIMIIIERVCCLLV